MISISYFFKKFKINLNHSKILAKTTITIRITVRNTKSKHTTIYTSEVNVTTNEPRNPVLDKPKWTAYKKSMISFSYFFKKFKNNLNHSKYSRKLIHVSTDP